MARAYAPGRSTVVDKLKSGIQTLRSSPYYYLISFAVLLGLIVLRSGKDSSLVGNDNSAAVMSSFHRNSSGKILKIDAPFEVQIASDLHGTRGDAVLRCPFGSSTF